jgi:type I restriction enzyme S subunit
LISVKGTTGRIGLVPVGFVGNISRDVARLRLRPEQEPAFWFQMLQSPQAQRTLQQAAVGSTRQELSISTLKELSFQFPALFEQERIAAILSDVDDLVAALDRTLIKKQSIKQGMMRQLLTGATRLPKFDGDWPRVALGTHATGLRGAGLNKEVLSPSGAYRCILYGELFTTYGRRISDVKSRTNVETGVRSQFGDVLVPGSTTTVARDLATASAVHLPGVLLGGDTNVIRPDKAIDPDWLAYYITHRLADRISEIAQGTTIKHLYVRDLLKCTVSLPEIDEQRAIVAALIDLQSEVTVLQKQLRKMKETKRGMMQELLSGHTRLGRAG